MKEEIILLSNTGLRGSAIARRLGCSRQYVSGVLLGEPSRKRTLSLPYLGLLNMAQTSKLLDVHHNTLRKWSDSGLLPCVRIGTRGDRRFRITDLLALMQTTS